MGMCLPSLDDLSYELIVEQGCGTNGDSTCGVKEYLSAFLNSSRNVVVRLLTDISSCWLVITICCILNIGAAIVLFFMVQTERGTPLMLWTNVFWLAALSVACSYASDVFTNRGNITPVLASKQSDIFSGWLLASVSTLCGFGTVVMLVANISFSFQSFKISQISIPGLDTGDDEDSWKDETDNSAMNVSTAASRTLVLAGKAISLVPSLLWSVLIQVTFTMTFLGCWFTVFFMLMANGTLGTDTLGVMHLSFDPLAVRSSVVFHFLFLMWVIEIMDVVVAIIGGGVVAVYVFAPTADNNAESDQRILPAHPLWHVFFHMGRFHLGTMVAGATVIMFTRPLRYIIDFIHFMRYGNGVNTSRWDSEKPDLDTCVGQIEHFYTQNILGAMRGVDKRALIQTVLHGTPFHSATVATWHLNKHYGKYMAVPLYASNVAMVITRNNIALSSCLLGHLLIMSECFDVEVNSLQNTLAPLMVIFFFGHFIGWSILCHLDAAVVTEMVGYAEAKLRLYTPGVPQLTVPLDLINLCEEARSADEDEMHLTKGTESTALIDYRADDAQNIRPSGSLIDN